MTKTSLMMSERAAASSGSSVFSACVAVLMHGRRSSFCQAAIMPKVAPSSRVIIASLLLPLFKDTLSLLLRTSIKLGGKIKGIWVESSRESTRRAAGDSCSQLYLSFVFYQRTAGFMH